MFVRWAIKGNGRSKVYKVLRRAASIASSCLWRSSGDTIPSSAEMAALMYLLADDPLNRDNGH